MFVIEEVTVIHEITIDGVGQRRTDDFASVKERKTSKRVKGERETPFVEKRQISPNNRRWDKTTY